MGQNHYATSKSGKGTDYLALFAQMKAIPDGNTIISASYRYTKLARLRVSFEFVTSGHQPH